MATHVTSQTEEPPGYIDSLIQSNFDQTATDLLAIMASQLYGAPKQKYGGLLRTTCSRSKAHTTSCSAKPRNGTEIKMISFYSPAISTLVGIFVMTWMTGKMGKMNAVSVFITLLFWGWLWGDAGLLLAIPILGIVNVISQHVEALQLLAESMRE